MSERPMITCTACTGEVAAGILYCWRHAHNPPKVGVIVEDHGQLVWQTTKDCLPRHERSVAVLLDGVQVQVRSVVEAQLARPARINLQVGSPDHTGAATTHAYVLLAALLDALVAGHEQIEATRA